MLRTRVMPCLLLKGKGLVKTVRFKNPTYIGDPINAVRIFNQKYVDELILIDIDATATNSAINFDLVRQITSECFMPLCYGGGVKHLDDFKRLFSLGVEKVAVSSLIFENSDVVKQAVAIYGSQSIVAVIDYKKNFWGKTMVFTSSGKVNRKVSPLQAAKIACELGIGELLLNSIDREGTWQGFDIEGIKEIASSIPIPLVALGGAGSLDDISQVVKLANASAVALGSMAVFQSQGMGVLIKFPSEKELNNVL